MSTLEQKLKAEKRSFRTKLAFGLLGGILLFTVVAPLAYFTHTVSFRIQPQPAADNSSVFVSDGAGVVIFDTAYILGGRAALSFASPGFISRTVEIDFNKGVKRLTVEMREAPVRVVITTEPALSRTRWYINGVYTGTAGQFERALQPGAVSIEANNEFYHPQTLQFEAQRGEDIARHVNLTPVTGNVSIRSEPAGALLIINSEKKGLTPVQIAAMPSGLHHVRVVLRGYENVEEEITVTNTLTNIRRDYRLKPKQTSVSTKASPAGDILRVNGAATSAASSLPPTNVRINGKGMGATPQTPRQKITRERSEHQTAALLATPSAAAVAMKFFDPRARSGSRFTMGAPKNEKARRANEFQRQVNLTKPFYVSTTEITEQQFAGYKPLQGTGKKHPVRNVSWLEAVGFCNWMSARSGLQPAYDFVDGQLRGFDPTADGYRLLSEAEWEWLARVAGRSGISRFVWGNDTTIPANSGNFADESARGSVPKYIPNYSDGFAGVAPVASFVADAAGLYDMAGNVSEWVHDIYDLRPPKPGRVEADPFGGRHSDGLGGGRVVKGSSFRSATITSLRSSFREGLLRGRDDVGFRVARYPRGKK